jgi:hypothetical protein
MGSAQQALVRGVQNHDAPMKRSPRKTAWNQVEFEFCSEGPSLAAPSLETRITCCSHIPEQRTHRPWVPIFADNLSYSVRNGFRPMVAKPADTPKKPKRQEGDPDAKATQERKVDETNYSSNIGQTVQTCKPALPQGRAIRLPASQSTELDQGSDGNQHPSISLPPSQDKETSCVSRICLGPIVSRRISGDCYHVLTDPC